MSQILCMSYSDFGSLLTDNVFDITTRRFAGGDYGVYENILINGPIMIKRRFFKADVSLFEDEGQMSSEPLLPPDIPRLEIYRDDTRVYVMASLDFENNFGSLPKNEYGMVLCGSSDLKYSLYDPELLAEDVVILASGPCDLNDISRLEQ